LAGSARSRYRIHKRIVFVIQAVLLSACKGDFKS
jgi:hypothetical protein